MPKTENVKLVGTVMKILGNAQFSIKCEKIEKNLVCYLAGKISKGHAKPIVNDTVEVEVYPLDITKGRIVKILR